MTESEWLVSDDPAAMLEAMRMLRFWPHGYRGALEDFVSDRKLRLFVEACYFAAGERNYEVERGLRDGWPNSMADIAMGWARCADKWKAARGAFLHDIVGNPFRPFHRVANVDGNAGVWRQTPEGLWHVLTPAILTPAVVALAQAAYDERTFPSGILEPGRLAVLADALEDAGCDNADILNHLRGTPCDFCGGSGQTFAVDGVNPLVNPREARCMVCGGSGNLAVHVRGCWALDLILGRE